MRGLLAPPRSPRLAAAALPPACAALLLAACGYQLARGGGLASGARQIRVAAVDNRTAQAEAGGVFAAALRDELSARGRLASEGAAEAPRLEPALLAVRSAPSAFGAASAAAYRIEADLRVRLTDAAGAAIYEDGQGGSEDYLAGVDVLGTEANRRAALRRLAASMARDAVDKMEMADRLR